jgi:hypothetical protein
MTGWVIARAAAERAKEINTERWPEIYWERNASKNKEIER